MHINNLIEFYPWISLIVSLYILIKSADFFIDGSENLGAVLGMNQFIIGATIVAIGSSLPELATSLSAVSDGQTAFPIDNVFGSNVTNILLAGGLVGIMSKNINVNYRTKVVDLPFLLITTGVFVFLILDGNVTKQEGNILLVLLAVFTIIMVISNDNSKDDNKKKPSFNFKDILYIMFGAVFVMLSSNFTIISVKSIASSMGVDMSVVTLIVVAFGTSLPEVAVTISAIKKGDTPIAIGNILGSNVFNILAVVGIPSRIATLTVSEKAFTNLPIFMLSTILFIIIVATSIKNTKFIGFSAIVAYVFFIILTIT